MRTWDFAGALSQGALSDITATFGIHLSSWSVRSWTQAPPLPRAPVLARDPKIISFPKFTEPRNMIQLADILVASSLPLHPYLLEQPRLSLRIAADGRVCGETPVVHGDYDTGIWEFHSSLHVPESTQWLTLALVANRERIKIQFASSTVSVIELLGNVKQQPSGHHEFIIPQSCSSMQLLMSCCIKLAKSSIVETPVSQAVANNHGAINMKNEYEQTAGSQPQGTGPAVTAREHLEQLYATLHLQSQDDRAHELSQLGSAYEEMHERWGEKVDLDKAIIMHEEAMQLTSCSHPQFPGRSHMLGGALQERFDRRGDIADLERSIRLYQETLETMEDDAQEKPLIIGCLGDALNSRFQRLGKLSDLEKAIELLQQAVKLTPDGHARKLTLLRHVGSALILHSCRIGNVAELNEGISILQKVVELTPDDDPGDLSQLATGLVERFSFVGDITDLEDAISSLQMARKLARDGHPDRLAVLQNLGTALQTRFEEVGNLIDINNAIPILQEAAEACSDGHPEKPLLLQNLGNAFERRFGVLGSLSDIENAILLKKLAVGLLPDGHRTKPHALDNLGTAFQQRFERIRNLSDIDDAILSLQKAVELTPGDHPEKVATLSNLGNALVSRFRSTENRIDIDNAVSSLQTAVKLYPDGLLAFPLNNLGYALVTRFRLYGNVADVNEAISILGKAVELTLDGHPDRPSRLYNFGLALTRRFDRLHAPDDLERALHCFSVAACSTIGPARLRFEAAREWARHSERNSRSPLPAASCAMDLLPRIAWLGLAVTDQHALLADKGEMVRHAVAAAIRWGEYERAVEWAEQGRAIAWQNLLGLRTPVDELRKARPDLADRLLAISRQMEGSVPSGPVSNPIQDISHGYSNLATEWELVVQEIRRLPNFNSFLRAKTFRELAPVAYDGPVVILNDHGVRCDALILIPHDSGHKCVSVVHIPLERFTYETSRRLFQQLKALLSSAGVRDRTIRKHAWVSAYNGGEAKFKAILRILWLDVVKPIIEGLAYQVESSSPPRIWWCATGFLSFLPIHAAGLYDTGVIGDRVSDYVVSSYTPTLNDILDLSNPIVREDFQLLTVAQPSTPYATPIPATEGEVNVVHRLAGSVRVKSLKNEEARVERVLQGMAESNWIHLACHGQQNVQSAMKSGFLLHDRILELSEIVKETLPKADFAFLSACQTATGDENVAEESVHLAAGMLLAGCRGVIATMWSIRDDDGPKIAEGVYKRILKDGRPNRKEAAYALHEAVKRLRESGVGFMAWVPFIHIGR